VTVTLGLAGFARMTSFFAPMAGRFLGFGVSSNASLRIPSVTPRTPIFRFPLHVAHPIITGPPFFAMVIPW